MADTAFCLLAVREDGCTPEPAEDVDTQTWVTRNSNCSQQLSPPRIYLWQGRCQGVEPGGTGGGERIPGKSPVCAGERQGGEVSGGGVDSRGMLTHLDSLAEPGCSCAHQPPFVRQHSLADGRQQPGRSERVGPKGTHPTHEEHLALFWPLLPDSGL